MATPDITASQQADQAPSASLMVAFRWPLAIVLCCLLLLLGVFYGLKHLIPHVPPLTITTINTQFLSTMPVFRAITGGNLEVGIAESTEIFKRSDARSTGFGWIYLGETTSEIRVPVTYRYHLALNGTWRLDQSGKVCIVTVPKLEASLPVAFETTRMEKYASNGWSRFDKTEQLDQLEKAITPTLALYAQDEKHMDTARQKFRPVVADFVRAWLLKEDEWRSDRFTSVIVVFEDEQSNTSPADAPTITVAPKG
jgi:hypothetical protein